MNELHTKEEFLKNITDEIKTYPSCSRYGQSVFNAIEKLYDVSRVVQFHDGIDCFWEEEHTKLVDQFIDKAYEAYIELETHANLHKPEFLENDEKDNDED